MFIEFELNQPKAKLKKKHNLQKTHPKCVYNNIL
jgi:hypothetical protein